MNSFQMSHVVGIIFNPITLGLAVAGAVLSSTNIISFHEVTSAIAGFVNFTH